MLQTSQEAIELALKAFRARGPQYRTLDAYYDGKHPLTFATDRYRNAFGTLFRAFALNICPTVVDAVADRLIVTGVQDENADESSAETSPLAASAWDIWRANRMDRVSGEVHREALKAGDSYVIVWPDKTGLPRIYSERASQVIVHYDESGEDPEAIDWASKAWMLDDGRCRLTMYYRDRIEKHVTVSTMSGRGLPTKGTAFVPFLLTGEPWPLPNAWERVPVFHFANGAGSGQFGTSELRDVIPIQNALNKSVTDLLIAGEYAAFRQRWATGLEIPIDPTTGKPLEVFKAAIDRLWAVADTEAKFGEFSESNTAAMRNTVDSFKVDVATVAGTPLHYLNLSEGQWPSGEALKTAEARFVKHVTDRQIAFGNSWEDVLAFALRIQGIEAEGLTTTWQDASPRSEAEMLQNATMKKGIGVSRKQILRELGYTDDQIAEMEADNQQEADQAAERAMAAFDRGGLGAAAG